MNNSLNIAKPCFMIRGFKTHKLRLSYVKFVLRVNKSIEIENIILVAYLVSLKTPWL